MIHATAHGDLRAIPAPVATLILTAPLDPARVERWQDRANELTAGARDLGPVPGDANIENLVRGIADTRAAAAAARSELDRVSGRIADAVGDGRDPSAVEAEAQAVSAKLSALDARLGPLEAKLREARASRNAQDAARDRDAKVRVRADLQGRIAAAVSGLAPESAILAALDEVAACRIALGLVGPA